MSLIVNLAGPVARYLEDKKDLSGPVFFRPYRSASDAATGVASIITAPFIFPVASIAAFVLASYELLSAIGSALTGSSDDATRSLIESASGFGVFLVAFY